jgi:hypothetical protein
MLLTEDSLLGVDVGADGYTIVEGAAACPSVEEGVVACPSVEEGAACPPSEANACRRLRRRWMLSCSRMPELEYWPPGPSSVMPKFTFIEA